jgi:hypothetical protein
VHVRVVGERVDVVEAVQIAQGVNRGVRAHAEKLAPWLAGRQFAGNSRSTPAVRGGRFRR